MENVLSQTPEALHQQKHVYELKELSATYTSSIDPVNWPGV